MWNRLLGAAAMGALLLVGSATQAQTTLNFGFVARPNSPDGKGAAKFASEVERLTQGRYVVRQQGAGALGGERDMLEGAQIGSIDLLITATAVLGNFEPQFSIIDIPFLFRDFDHAYKVLKGPIGQSLLAKLPPKGFVGLALGGNGFRQLTNNRHPVNSVEDMRGLKLRTMENQIHLTAWRNLGALPTPMALPEVFTALQTGTIDGQENPVGAIIGNRFGEVQKFLTITNHAFTGVAIVMSGAAYSALSDADKKLFVQAAEAGMQEMRERNEEITTSGIQELERIGMKVVTTVDRAKIEERLRPAYAEFSKRFGQAAIDAIRNVQ